MCICRDAETSPQHPHGPGRRDFAGADQVEKTLLSFPDIFILVFQVSSLSLAHIMYINESTLYPVSYRNRITIVLETDDIICLTSNGELNFDLRAWAIKPACLLSHYFPHSVASRGPADKRKTQA